MLECSTYTSAQKGFWQAKPRGGKTQTQPQQPRPSAFHRMPDVADRVRTLRPWPWIRGADCWPALQLGWTQMAGLPCDPGLVMKLKQKMTCKLLLSWKLLCLALHISVAVEKKVSLEGNHLLLFRCACIHMHQHPEFAVSSLKTKEWPASNPTDR